MNSIYFETDKLTEIYVGTTLTQWTFAIADYTADCTKAIPFTPFEKVICGLLNIDDILSFEEIASILGLNVIDNIENNQYKDIAEHEILVEALTSLFDCSMIEKGDSFFSRCRLTDIGKEYAAKGKKIKITENKKFQLYFDLTANNHENAKEIFQDIKPDKRTYHRPVNHDYFSDENYIKTFAQNQISEIYSPEYGNSFTNSSLNKIYVCSVNLYFEIFYDFQLNTYRLKVFNKQTETNYFTEKANAIEEVKTKIIRNYFSSLPQANSSKSEKQIVFEEKTCEVQNDDYLLYQNKPQDAIEKINQYYKETEIIDMLCFWQNLDSIIDNGVSEVFFNIPELDKIHYDAIQKLSKAQPELKIFLDFQNTKIGVKELSNNIFRIDTSSIPRFGCIANRMVFKEMNYHIQFEENRYTTIVISKEQTDNINYIANWKKRFAQKYIPVLLDELQTFLQSDIKVSLQNIEAIQNADIKVLYFENWFANFGFAEQYSHLKQSQNELLECIKQQHKDLLLEKIEHASNGADIESIEKLEQINNIKIKVEAVESECMSEYVDVLEKVEKLKTELIEKELYIKDQLLAKHYIIDTNVFIDYPEILSKIDIKHNVVLSARVIDELDKLKCKLKGAKKENAEKALKLINQKFGKKKSNIRTARADVRLLPIDFNDKSPDNLILCVALMYKDKNPFLITSDNGLQVKAKACEIPVYSLREFVYEKDKNPQSDKKLVSKSMKSTQNKQITAKQLIKIYNSAIKTDEGLVLLPNFMNAIVKSITGFSCENYGFTKFQDFCISYSEIFDIVENSKKAKCIKLKNKK
jgi:rRNA-processing protein FCF1